MWAVLLEDGWDPILTRITCCKCTRHLSESHFQQKTYLLRSTMKPTHFNIVNQDQQWKFWRVWAGGEWTFPFRLRQRSRLYTLQSRRVHNAVNMFKIMNGISPLSLKHIMDWGKNISLNDFFPCEHSWSNCLNKEYFPCFKLCFLQSQCNWERVNSSLAGHWRILHRPVYSVLVNWAWANPWMHWDYGGVMEV